MAVETELKEQELSSTMKPVILMGKGIRPDISSCIEKIVDSVNEEFGTKAGLFTPIALRMDLRAGEEFEATKKAGVYVFIDENGRCLKVGKSQTNASKRALQHCGSDDTSSKDGTIHMADLRDSDKAYMLVFALQENSLHWVLALEHFLENKQSPIIRSQRNG